MNKLVKRSLRFFYYLPTTVLNRIQYIFKNVSCGFGHETSGLLYIKNRGTIKIGDNVRINSSGKANPIGFTGKTYFQVFKTGVLLIGNHTRISNCAITSKKAVLIGNYVRIGAGVKIYDTNFHSLNPYERTSEPEVDSSSTASISINDYAFIGAGSIILKGVTIGKYSVIGAGSVVTHNVPSLEIWAGNPARKIGELFVNENENI